MTIFLFFLGLTSLLCSPVLGQDSVAQYRPVPPPVSYEIHGRLDLAHRILTATIDIDVRRDSSQSVVWLSLPGDIDSLGRGKEFTLDSLLLNGAPFEFGSNMVGTRLVRISPGESGQPHLLLTYSLRLPAATVGRLRSGTLVLEDWYPFVAKMSYTESGAETKSPSRAIADYAVEMRVDSSVTLAATGGLRNARERYGILPDRGDTVLFDIARSSLDRARTTGATKTYDWQTGPSAGFDIGVFANTTINMAVGSGLKLMIFGAGRQSKAARDLLVAGRKLLTYLVSQYGTPANTEFSAVFGATSRTSYRFGNLIVLPLQARNTNILVASLAVQLASQYFSPSNLETAVRGLPWTEGASVYAATAALYSLYGTRGYDMMEQYGNWMFPRPKIGRPMTRQFAFGWMEAIRTPRVKWTRADSLRYEELFVVPSALYSIGSLVGEERLRRALYQYSLSTRNGPVQPAKFVQYLSSRIGDVRPDLFQQWQAYGGRLDWSIDDIRVQRTYTSVIITGRVRRNGMRAMPVEFGVIVPSGDTLSKNIVPDSSSTGSPYMPFSIEVLDKPVALILDPYHYLPDANRENNVFVFGLGPVRLRTGATEYPAFRRLERGE